MADELTQRVNDLRFQILTKLGEGGADLVRDFESALAEERPALLTVEQFRHPDRRARALADAEVLVNAVQTSLGSAEVEHLPSLSEALADAIRVRDEARALPEHEYVCWECEQTFQSPGRRTLFLAADVKRDESGTVVRGRRFRIPAPMVICPACADKMGIGEYLGLPKPPTPEEVARVHEKRVTQRKRKRIRE